MTNEQFVIDNYGPFLDQYLPTLYPYYPYYSYPALTSTVVFRPLSMNEVVTEISHNRPIIIGIAPEGGWAIPNESQHVAVLIGYDTSDGKADVVVNDPYPYYLDTSKPNPYFVVGASSPELGQYVLPISLLVQQMLWSNSIYQIH